MAREDHWAKPKLPDWSHYEAQAYENAANERRFNMGALKFEKRISRRLQPTNQRTLGANHNSNLLLHGLDGQACTKNVKCFVQMDRQSKRDGAMYSFAKQDLVEIARQFKKKNIEFQDCLPNNLERRRPETRPRIEAATK